MALAIIVGIIVFAAILGPYLYKEITRGKAELGPELKQTSHGVEFGAITPTGSGDNHAGNRQNPAPDQPDAQEDPYGPRAQRNSTPIED